MPLIFGFHHDCDQQLEFVRRDNDTTPKLREHEKVLLKVNSFAFLLFCVFVVSLLNEWVWGWEAIRVDSRKLYISLYSVGPFVVWKKVLNVCVQQIHS